MAKYLLIAAIVISLATAGIGFVNHNTLVETKDSLATTTANLEATKKSIVAAQTEVKTTNATLEASKADQVKLANELVASQGEAAAAKAQVDAAAKTAADQTAQIATLTEENTRLKNGGTPTPGPETGPSVADLQNQIQELTASVSSISEKAKADQALVAEYKKKDEDRLKGQMKIGLEGRVLAVNPAWNFVVLSIGDKQGVTNNSEMLLKRSGQYLGKVRITSVEPSTSIADIVANTMPSGVAVQPGDSVIFQSTTQE